MNVNTGTPVCFKQFIDNNYERIPLVFEVQEGCYGNVLGGPRDFSTGEIFRVESIEHVVNVTFSDVYSISSERGLITLPLDFRGLFCPVEVRKVGKTKSRPAKSFQTIKSILSDPGLPCTVYSANDIQTPSITIKKGTKVEIIKTVEFTKHGNVFVLCKCYLPNATKNILLGIETTGFFENVEKQHTLKELLQRMPIQVFYVTDSLGCEGQGIPGLPTHFSEPLFLSKVDVVRCRPVVDTSEIIRIPVDTEFTVKQINLSDDHFNPTKNIHDLIKHEMNFPICVEVVDFDDALKISGIMRDLQSEQLLIVEAVDEIEKVLTRGKERCFTVPIEKYKGRFKMVPKVFQTADDIWQNHFTKKVRVTEDYIVSSSQMDSIFLGDVLAAKEMRVLSLQREECEVIVCSRESTVLNRSTTVRIPSYAIGGFEEVDYPQESFTLARIPNELPLRARLQATPHQRKHNEDDELLRDESPLTFDLFCTETDILVSVFDETTNTTTHKFFIPQHKYVRVKERRMPLRYTPKSDSNQVYRLMIDILSEADYKSMCSNHREYEDAPPVPPPIPPRSDTKPKEYRTSTSLNVTDSSDDDNYDKPEEVSKLSQRSVTFPILTGAYVVPKIRPTIKAGISTITKKFRRQRAKVGTSESSVEEHKYESMSSETDVHDYIQPIIRVIHPGVAHLEKKLADMDVNPEVLQKVHELSLTETELIHQLNTCSDRDLMQRLKLKTLEIIALRSILK